MMRLIALAAAAIAACLSLSGGATAQTYPTRTVKFILPYGAASATDITARLLADRLSTRWGKPVIVENRPGGDGIVSILHQRRGRSHAVVRPGWNFHRTTLRARYDSVRRQG